MTAVTEARPVAAPPAGPQHLRATASGSRARTVLPAAAALAGGGVLWAVLRDGEPRWQAVRGVVAVVVTAVVVLGLRRTGQRGGSLLATAVGPLALAYRQAADKAWLSDELGARGWFQEQVERLTYALTDLLTDADPPIALRDAVAATAPRPVLLIAGGAAHDERTEARYIAEGSPGTAEVWVVPGAGHTAGLDTDPAEWERRDTDFLDAAL